MEGAFDYIRRDQGGIDDVALLAQKVAIGLAVWISASR